MNACVVDPSAATECAFSLDGVASQCSVFRNLERGASTMYLVRSGLPSKVWPLQLAEEKSEVAASFSNWLEPKK